MIHCLSCECYSYNKKIISYENILPIDTYKVNLISKNVLNELPTNGDDVEELPNGMRFATGSRLYIVNGESGSEIYIYNGHCFALFDISNQYSKSYDGTETSDEVGTGRIGYMELIE